jgi:tetratricopeptide (TPR) repeat protein
MISELCKTILPRCLNFTKPLFCIAIYTFTIYCNLYIREHRQISQKQEISYHLPTSCYLSFKNIIADYYWFKLCYAEDLSADYTYGMAEFITNLDPHFTVVYRYAGIFLTMQKQQYDLAINLLRKALTSPVNNADWRISFYVAHNYYYGLHDKKQAAIYYAQAAERTLMSQPPPYLKKLARSLIG